MVDPITWYKERLQQHGSGGAAVGFDDAARRELRWEVLLSASPSIATARVLDAGCGLADLLPYLRDKYKFTGEYTGCDILPDYIELAARRFPEARFLTLDLCETAPAGKYDLVFANGLFTLNFKDPWERLSAFLSSAYQVLDPGGVVALNLFSARVNYRDPDFAYYEMEKVIDLLHKQSKSFALRHDYLPYDYSVYLYKTQEQ